jgi:hypothetical protein
MRSTVNLYSRLGRPRMAAPFPRRQRNILAADQMAAGRVECVELLEDQRSRICRWGSGDNNFMTTGRPPARRH